MNRLPGGSLGILTLTFFAARPHTRVSTGDQHSALQPAALKRARARKSLRTSEQEPPLSALPYSVASGVADGDSLERYLPACSPLYDLSFAKSDRENIDPDEVAGSGN